MLALSNNIIETLINFVIAVIERLGYGGAFVGMTLESTGLPLPSEIITAFAEYVVWEGQLTLLGITLAGTLGCLAGFLVAYGIGAYGGRPLLERYGKYVFIRKSELDCAKTGYKYPTIRLPYKFYVLAGLSTRIYQIVHDGALAVR